MSDLTAAAVRGGQPVSYPPAGEGQSAADWCLRGNALLEAGDAEAATAAYEHALKLGGERGPLLNNLGNARYRIGDFAGALGHYLAAMQSMPRHSQILTHLGATLTALRQLPAAQVCLDEAVRLDPGSASARWHRGLFRLLIGDWPGGWLDYESRWQVQQFSPHEPRFRAPRWDGSTIDSGRLLLYAEQGYGDALQFLRYIPLVQGRCPSLVVVVPKPLQRLVATSYPSVTVLSEGDRIPQDVVAQLSLLSIPALLGQTTDDVPADVPYVMVSEADVRHWRAKLAQYRRPLIGLAWAGGARPENMRAHELDRRRSMSLLEVLPLASSCAATWVSLQVGPASSQAAQWPSLVDVSEHLHDFAATAALVSCLDLVVTVDTAVAHVAGALGVPVWILSRFDGCWRWLHGRDDSLWYPSARIFRQPEPHNWNAVVVTVEQQLRLRYPIS